VCDISIAISEKEINLNADKNIITAKLSDKKDGRKSPNPNVMVELGYAIHTLGWNKILMFFDSSEYAPEDLPFDIKQHVPVFLAVGIMQLIKIMGCRPLPKPVGA